MRKFYVFVVFIFSVLLISCETEVKDDGGDNTAEEAGKISTVSTSAELLAALKNPEVATVKVQSGTYDEAFTVDRKIVLEAEDNVTIKQLTVDADGSKIMSPTIGTLIASAKLGEGSVELADVTVTNKAVLAGGGRNSIKVSGSSMFTGIMQITKSGLGFKLGKDVAIAASVAIDAAIFIEPLLQGKIPTISGQVTINVNNVYVNIVIPKLNFGSGVTALSLGSDAVIDTKNIGNIVIKGPVETNLALQRTATSSSNETSLLGPGNAIDGDEYTRWASGSSFSNPQWIQVDLGSSMSVNKLSLSFEAGSSDYDVHYSADGKTWTAIAVNVSTLNGGVATYSNLGIEGRYFRMLARDTYGTAGVSLYEFEVLGVK